MNTKFQNHRNARALALVNSSSMHAAENGTWSREGRDYVIDPNAETCDCAEARRNAAMEAGIEKQKAALAEATLAGKANVAMGCARLLAQLEANFPGPGCKHLAAVQHLLGKVDLRNTLAGLSKTVTPGFEKYEGGVYLKDAEGKPVLTSPYEDALSVYRAEMLAIARVRIEMEKQLAPAAPAQPMRIPGLVVTCRKGVVLEVAPRVFKTRWSFRWPCDAEGHFLPDEEAFGLAALAYAPLKFNLSKAMFAPAVAGMLKPIAIPDADAVQ